MSEKKNILLITIDALRADHVSCFGYHRKTTPNIDNIAKEGVLFSQVIANGHNTAISFLSILTSTYPLMYRDSSVYPHSKSISRQRTLISEILKKEGFNTAAFTSAPFISKVYGYNRGFDTFEDCFSILNEDRNILELNKDEKINKTKQKIKEFLIKSNTIYNLVKFISNIFSPYKSHYPSANIINQRAISWLREQSRSNFFLWIHYMDVHYPYVPPQKYLQKFRSKSISKGEMLRLLELELKQDAEKISNDDIQKIIALYDGGISYVDDKLKELLDEVKKMGICENTFVIIIADHGDEFKDHGGMGHHAKFYEELIHIPLIIRGPGINRGVIVDDPVGQLDIAPTILDLLNIKEVENFQGNSVVPLMNGLKTIKSKGIISETLQNKGKMTHDGKGYRLTSYRTNGWKYLLNEENNQRELYNLKDDSKETRNLYASELKRAKEFESKIVEHILMEEKVKHLINEKEKIKRLINRLENIGKI